MKNCESEISLPESLNESSIDDIEILLKLLQGDSSLSSEHGFVLSKPITGITFDSRQVTPGSVFFAIPGYKDDGARFIGEAISKGASLLVVPKSAPSNALEGVDIPYLKVSDIRSALSFSAEAFYNHPSREMKMVGITGTNGKTSTAWMVSQLLSSGGASCLYIGTIGHYILKSGLIEKLADEGRTTVDPVYLSKGLADAAYIRACSYGVLEATSHGLEQKRTFAIDWDVAAFSNLTQDHLDQHLTMEAYGAAKARLFFDELSKSKKQNTKAVINIDDQFGMELAERINKDRPHIEVIRVSEKDRSADLILNSISYSCPTTKLSCTFRGHAFKLETGLLGSFSYSNLLLSCGIAIALGESLENITLNVPKVKSAPGRLESATDSLPRIFVDYAHTPDALEKVQKVLIDILHTESAGEKIRKGRLITVFGCGGDRDKSKRPLMGQAVAEISDVAIPTSDNPRTEKPEAILEDIIPGIVKGAKGRDLEYISIVDRKEALKYALDIALEPDIILIAGKGHEDYQEIDGVKYPFDDKVIAQELLKNKFKKK